MVIDMNFPGGQSKTIIKINSNFEITSADRKYVFTTLIIDCLFNP